MTINRSTLGMPLAKSVARYVPPGNPETGADRIPFRLAPARSSASWIPPFPIVFRYRIGYHTHVFFYCSLAGQGGIS